MIHQILVSVKDFLVLLSNLEADCQYLKPFDLSGLPKVGCQILQNWTPVKPLKILKNCVL